jgi:hypothetical protein
MEVAVEEIAMTGGVVPLRLLLSQTGTFSTNTEISITSDENRNH